MDEDPTQMHRIERVPIGIHDLLVDAVEELRQINAQTYAAKGSLDDLVDHFRLGVAMTVEAVWRLLPTNARA